MSPLPSTCTHGNYWPDQCDHCQQIAHERPTRPRKPEKPRAPRKPWPEPPELDLDDETAALAEHLAALWPQLNLGERAIAWSKNPGLRREWERIWHEQTNKPLF